METRTPVDVQRILEERARRLSIVPELPYAGEQKQIVTFVIGGEAYGIDVTHIHQIHPVRGLVTLPSTPEFVAGVINIRGTLYSVINLRRFLGLLDAGAGSPAKVVLVTGAGLTVGILADEVGDVRTVPVQDIGKMSSLDWAVREEYVFGIMPDALIILNLDAILGDRRMIVAAADME
ncbi:MAG TPA: chemotaxis protein CheW [bacterium]|nr:chemotaxis protein CheW [bacterium]